MAILRSYLEPPTNLILISPTRNPLWSAVMALALSLLVPRALAEGTNDPAAELKDLISRINVKLTAGTNTETGLAPELKEFDVLLARHKNEKTENVAQILYMKAKLYSQVFGNTARAIELMNQVKHDYPDLVTARLADRDVAQVSLAAGRFPDFEETDVAGKPLSVSNYKGKVVLVDFWATWCRPCVGEVPNVIKAYQKFHDRGFEVIGISLDRDKDQLTTFIRQKEMPWQQCFDSQGKLSGRYGIVGIPTTYLLDRDGKIIARDLRGGALEEMLARVLPEK